MGKLKNKKHKTRSLSDYFDGLGTPEPIQAPQPPPPSTPQPLFQTQIYNS
jgi:hypothetical protein